MRKYFFVYFLLFLPVSLTSQNGSQYETGLPFISNYLPEDYKAASQNRGIVQDSRGVIYIANGDGVLEYDGVHWRIIKIAKDYPANSVAIDNNNRIFVGSAAEFGYLTPNKYGVLKYVSLLGKFEISERKFNSISRMYSVKDGIYFIAGDRLYRWQNNKLRSWRFNKPYYCYKYGDNILVWQNISGIKKIQNDSVIKIKGGDYFSKIPIQNILPYKNDMMLIITRDSGMYLMSDPSKLMKGELPSISRFYNQADYFIKMNLLNYSTALSNGCYAFASIRGGTAIMDSKGILVQILDKSTGVKNDSHSGVAQDKQNALWLSSDNGVTRVDISSPFYFWNDDMGLKGKVLCILRFKERIFAGTIQGLFYHNFSPEKYYLSGEGVKKNVSQFEIIKSIKSSVWDMLVVKNAGNTKEKLLVATSTGVFETDIYSTKIVAPGSFTKFHRCEKDPSKIFASGDDGIKCISVSAEGGEIYFKDEGMLNGFAEKIENFGEDKSGRIWISSMYAGIYSLEFLKWKEGKIVFPVKEKTAYKFTHYDTSAGVPSDNGAIYKIKSRLFFVYKDGIYYPVRGKNNKTIKFVRDKSYITGLFNDAYSISSLSEDDNGNIWLHLTDKKTGRKIIMEALFANGTYSFKSNPFRLIPPMEVYSIFPENNNVTWFGGDDGIVKYDGNIKYNFNQEYQALISKVVLESDSVLFGGIYFKNVSDSGGYSGIDTIQTEILKSAISYNYNHLTFEYAAPGYYDNNTKKFRVCLEGFDDNWSEWTTETKKEYTNLQPGKYKFHVIAKNIFDKESREAVYEFRILAPWYRTWLAYLVYLLAVGFLVFSAIRFSNKRLRLAAIKLHEEIKKETAAVRAQQKELEMEKEKSDKLLLNILPFKIAQELKKDGHAKTKFFEQVTVMFTDFKDFTVIAQQLEPHDLISELNRCFVFFDDVCVRHNIEKIKTIGDAYMCVGGVPVRNKTNPADVVLAAMEMRDFISRLKREQSVKGQALWKIRIGVHTGPIISGVVGKKKFAYDVWGDTVNTASRLEQTSLPNHINISESTYELVKDMFECENRGEIPVKHKGNIVMYFVKGIKKELSVDDEGIIPNQKFWELYAKLND